MTKLDVATLEAAISRRPAAIRSGEVWRVLDGTGDGVPNLYVDRFGHVLLAHALDDGAAALLADPKVCVTLCEMSGARTLYLRKHERDAKATAQLGAALLHGAATEELVVHEGKMRFMVRPAQQVNAGLFIDTRGLRALLEQSCTDARVLNTFCFTGSLGIAAFCGRAREVVQVDASAGILRWARENLALNSGAPDAVMRFITEDTLTFLQREERRGSSYDVVLLDPPAFGRAGKRQFVLERELPVLCAAAAALVRPGGRLSVTCNLRKFDAERVRQIVTTAVSQRGRLVKRSEPIGPGPDFTAKGMASRAVRGVLAVVE